MQKLLKYLWDLKYLEKWEKVKLNLERQDECG
jgi:hypothetical protein